jgi:hypothetical protein
VVNFLKRNFFQEKLVFCTSGDNNTLNNIQMPDYYILQLPKYLFFFEASTGRYFKGYFAFRAICKYDSKLRWIIPVLYFPGVSLVGKITYRIIAKNRKKLSGPGASCGI